MAEKAVAPRTRCKYGTGCYQKQESHRTRFSHPGDHDWESSEGEPLWVALRVTRAEILVDRRPFTSMGLREAMRSFAVVEFQARGGDGWREVSRTRTDTSGDTRPQWDHMCQALPFMGPGHGDRVSFKVSHQSRVASTLSFLGAGSSGGRLLGDCLIGKAVCPVDDLLGSAAAPGGRASFTQAPTCVLPLLAGSETVGSVVVQALLVKTVPEAVSSAACAAMTFIDSGRFQSPAVRLAVSGGTAPFFRLRLKDAPVATCDRFIGKDLSRATDEADFYEQVLQLSKEPDAQGLSRLLPFMFDYAGVLKCPVVEAEEPAGAPAGGKAVSSAAGAASAKSDEKDLLVMENLFAGCKKLRLLDVKVGEKTASAGWQGKSYLRALKQGLVDGCTNSVAEGFRLEGFDGAPPALKSMDPLLDIAAVGTKATGMREKLQRMLYQRLPAAGILLHFLDVHQVPEDPGTSELTKMRAPIELAEIVLHEVVCRLAKLALACRLTPVPQKWVGSSIALGFDAGAAPPRSLPEDELRQHVRVSIFDWGRSELNTLSNHLSLSEAKRRDRDEFWGYYVGGVDRLLWEAMRAYWHRFGNVVAGTHTSRPWRKASIRVMDFDSMCGNDYIGQVTFPLVPTPEQTVALLDTKKQPVMGVGGKTPSQLTFSVEYRPLPQSSRLKGVWRVHIKSASGLPAMDQWQGRGKSDCFAVLHAVSADGRCQSRCQTCVIPDSLEPVWEETLEVPEAAQARLLDGALASAATTVVCPEAARELVSGQALHDLLPEAEAGNPQVEAAIESWTIRLDQAAQAAHGSVFLPPSRARTSRSAAARPAKPHTSPSSTE